MRKRIFMMIYAVLVLVVVGMVLVPTAQAAGTCNLLTLKGSYGYTITGTAFSTPIAGVGAMTFDGAGNILGNDTTSFGGTITPSSFTGSYTVNADCTGKLAISFFGGAFVVPADTVIVDNGKEIMLIVTVPGEVVTGNMKRQ